MHMRKCVDITTDFGTSPSKHLPKWAQRVTISLGSWDGQVGPMKYHHATAKSVRQEERSRRTTKNDENVRDKFLHRGFCTSETRIWGRILGNKFWTPEFRTRILGSNFLILFFSSKRGPLKNSPSRISPLRIHLPKFNPEIGPKKFTLHLCREIWLRKCKKQNDDT